MLRRHGFAAWEDLYPSRQRHVLEHLLSSAKEVDGPVAVRRALTLAIVGSIELAGLASRWDRWYLKSYEAMSNHRFNVTTFAAEPNVMGAGIGRAQSVRGLPC